MGIYFEPYLGPWGMFLTGLCLVTRKFLVSRTLMKSALSDSCNGNKGAPVGVNYTICSKLLIRIHSKISHDLRLWWQEGPRHYVGLFLISMCMWCALWCTLVLHQWHGDITQWITLTTQRMWEPKYNIIPVSFHGRFVKEVISFQDIFFFFFRGISSPLLVKSIISFNMFVHFIVHIYLYSY